MDTMERGTSTNRVLPGIGSKACGSSLRPKPAVTPPPEPDAQPTCASGQGAPRHAKSSTSGTMSRMPRSTSPQAERDGRRKSLASSRRLQGFY